MKRKTLIFASLVWSLAILFFIFDSFLRVFLGTVASQFMAQLHLSAQQFSLIGSAYFVIYGIMQTPVGILTEKYGTRLILSLACLMSSFGVLGLASATGFYSVFVSRVLIGLGSSFSFVAILILALNWFPREYFGFLSGVALFLGSGGSFLGGAPLAYLSEMNEGNWRIILFWTAAFSLILTVLLAFFMRTKPKEKEQKILFITPHEPLLTKLKLLFNNRQAWLIILCAGLLYASLPLLAAFWGTTYLQSRGLNQTSAALLVSIVWVGFAVGSPLVGKMSDRAKRRIPFLLIGSILGVGSSIAILYAPTNQAILGVLFFLLGLASSTQALTYALIVEHTPSKLNSASLGLNNTSVMLFSAFIPPIAGFMIQASLLATGFVSLQTRNFLAGLSLMPVCYATAGVITVFGIRETFCRQQHEIHKLDTFHKASDLI